MIRIQLALHILHSLYGGPCRMVERLFLSVLILSISDDFDDRIWHRHSWALKGSKCTNKRAYENKLFSFILSDCNSLTTFPYDACKGIRSNNRNDRMKIIDKTKKPVIFIPIYQFIMHLPFL